MSHVLYSNKCHMHCLVTKWKSNASAELQFAGFDIKIRWNIYFGCRVLTLQDIYCYYFGSFWLPCVDTAGYLLLLFWLILVAVCWHCRIFVIIILAHFGCRVLTLQDICCSYFGSLFLPCVDPAGYLLLLFCLILVAVFWHCRIFVVIILANFQLLYQNIFNIVIYFLLCVFLKLLFHY